MLGIITVKIPLINEDWQMPLYLKESLYKCIFADPYNTTAATYEQWFESLSDEDKDKIRRIKLVRPY